MKSSKRPYLNVPNAAAKQAFVDMLYAKGKTLRGYTYVEALFKCGVDDGYYQVIACPWDADQCIFLTIYPTSADFTPVNSPRAFFTYLKDHLA